MSKRRTRPSTGSPPRPTSSFIEHAPRPPRSGRGRPSRRCGRRVRGREAHHSQGPPGICSRDPSATIKLTRAGTPNARARRGCPPGWYPPPARPDRVEPPARPARGCRFRSDRLWVRRVRELAEEARDHEGDLFADVDGVVADAFEGAGDHDHGHRPFQSVAVLAATPDGHLKDLAVKAVDFLVLADEVFGEGDVTQLEGLFGLSGLGGRQLSHPIDRGEDLLVDGGVVAGERDELGDVDGLVAHALDVLDDVQERRHGAQVGGDRRLGRQQGKDALVDLEVAAVDAVVVGDHELGKLDVLGVERFQGTAESGDDQVEATQGCGLEAADLFGKRLPGLGHYPNFPLMYCSVRVSWGLVNILSVSPYSTRLPGPPSPSMKAV